MHPQRPSGRCTSRKVQTSIDARFHALNSALLPHKTKTGQEAASAEPYAARPAAAPAKPRPRTPARKGLPIDTMYGTLPLPPRAEARPKRYKAYALALLGAACVLIASSHARMPVVRVAGGLWDVSSQFLAPGETQIAPNIARSTWTAGTGQNPRRLEEHYLARKTPEDWWSGHVFLKQAYSYWRYGVCSERAMADAAPLSVESYRYDDREALLSALREGLISQGAVVWAAVSDEAVDTDVQFESLVEKVPVERLQHGVAGDVACVAASAAVNFEASRRWRGG
jgi:hypothetical protein